VKICTIDTIYESEMALKDALSANKTIASGDLRLIHAQCIREHKYFLWIYKLCVRIRKIGTVNYYIFVS